MNERANDTGREIDLGTLREGFAALGDEPPATAAGPCPEPATLYAAVRGELPPGDVRAAVEHVAACPQCAEDWRLAMAFEDEAREAEAAPAAFPAVASAPTGGSLRLLRMAAGVVIALLAVGVWFTVGQDEVGEPVYRDAPERAVESALAGDVLDRSEPVLRWRVVGGDGAPEGTTYSVRVTEGLTPVAEAHDLEEPSYRLPAEALADLAEGATLSWKVEASFPDGGTAASRTFRTSLDR